MSRTLTPPPFGRLSSQMKSSALFILLTTAVAGYGEVATVPERFPLDRYAKLKSDPPFAVKSDIEPTAPPKIDWAESLYLSGASKDVVNGEEKDWVYIGHKSDPSAGFQLYGKDPGKDDIQIVKLDWHPENPAKTVVHLKRGTEFAIIKRDEMAFTAPSVPQQPGGTRQPGQPIVRPPGQPAPGVTAIPNAAGAIRQPVVQPRAPVIPRPTGGVVPPPQTYPQPAAGAQPQGQQGQPNDRRRIRVINSPR